jgi:tyrosyl-tRNA synthetase
MSKSLNNYVGLKEDALSMYSKLEKTPDTLLKDYFELLTNLPLEKLPDNPRESQKLLAVEVTSQFHGREKALQAQKTAQEIVLGASASDSNAVPEYSLADVQFPAKLAYILNVSGLCKSSGDGKRQIEGGAVRLDSDRVTDNNIIFDSPQDLAGKVLQVGKKKFVRLIL